MRRLVVLALLIGGALLLEPLRVPTESVIAPRSLFLFGLLLLVADTLGALMHDIGIPRIVGYVAAGILLGPSVTNVVPSSVLSDMGMMQSLAVGLIGLLAGAELRLSDLRERWRSIASILLFQMLFVVVFLTAAVMLARPLVPFLAGLGFVPLLLVSLVLASMLTVNSPMVTIALLTETRAWGPVAKTTLGVVLVADVVVIFLFTGVLSIAQASFGGGTVGFLPVLGGLLREVTGAILAGVIIGALVSAYLKYVKRELVVFVVVVVFAVTALAEALHFEFLLSLLVAGFLVENVAPVRAEPFVRVLEQISWPIFVVFFALTGAELRLSAFATLWPVVVIVVLVRLAAVVLGTRVGAALSGAEEPVRRYGWSGLVSQAGVALGFASLVATRFPDVGLGLQAVTVGVITVNTSMGPILFRLGLTRAGEVSGGEGAEVDAGAADGALHSGSEAVSIPAPREESA